MGVHGGESWTPALRARIERGLGIEVFNTYGLSEVIGPGVAQECSAHRGLHLYEDHFLAEVIAPGTTDPVPEGEVGELLLTTLSAQANRQLASVRLEPARTLHVSDWPHLESSAASAMLELGLEVPVHVVPPGTLPRSSGKAPRVVIDS